MNYRVVVQRLARQDLLSYARRIALNAPQTAEKWLERFQQALQALARNPRRCQLA